MNLDYPYHFDHRGRTAATSDADHIRDLIEQVLFTTPGERVNRPGFGSGVMQLVFAPNSESPEHRSSHQDGTSAERKRLGHVLSPSNATVEEHFDLPLHCVDHLGKEVERRTNTVELPPPVIRDDDPVDAVVHGDPRVLG